MTADSPANRPDLVAALTLPEFPRAAAYEPRWVLENLMGPDVLWLTEALTQVMELRPGMRVLDLGCGRAISSIFLAKEFGLDVWAADLWIKPDENWQRIRDAGVADRVVPLAVEAHTLPFAHNFFDAMVSLDAYHYFGTNDLYLGYLAPFIKPGGQLGIVVPGLRHELTSGLPEYLVPYWQPEFWSFHSPEWWRRHWPRTGPVDVDHADLIPNGWQHWLRWLEIAAAEGFSSSADEAAMIRADAGRNLRFSRIVGRRETRDGR